MNDLATLTGRPRRLDAGGRAYRLFPQTMGTLGRFQGWLDGQVPDADDAVMPHLGGLTADAQRYVLGLGCRRVERARPLIGTAAAQDLTYSVAGVTELLYLSVKRGDRRFTRRRAASLYWELGDAGLRKVVWTVWGGAVSPDDREDDDDPPEAPPVDWWGTWHALMGEPFGFPPQRVAGMTWPQVVCALGDGKPLDRPRKLETFEEHQAFLDRRKTDPWAP